MRRLASSVDCKAVKPFIRQQHNTIRSSKKNSALIAPKPPAPTVGDRITGKAREQLEKYEEEQLKYVALIEHSRNVVLMGQRARVQQAKAITRLRQEVEEAREFEGWL